MAKPLCANLQLSDFDHDMQKLGMEWRIASTLAENVAGAEAPFGSQWIGSGSIGTDMASASAMILRLLLTSALVLAPVTSAYAETLAVPDYPNSRSEPIVEDMFGEQVADPYRWLEGDVRTTPEVAEWVAQQNAVTEAFFDQLSARSSFGAKLAQLHDFERFGTPTKAGQSYFYTRNSGLLNQSQLFVQQGIDAQRRLLIDPNAWADDGATALASWYPSQSGSLLAYTVQDGGTDWRIVKVVDVATGAVLTDEVRWAKFTNIAWVGDEGFFYSRFPEPEKGGDFQELNFNHTVYFHRIGTDQGEDELVFASPDTPKASHRAQVTSDGRWAVIISTIGTDDRNEVWLIDLTQRKRHGWRSRHLVKGFKNSWQIIDSIDGVVYARTKPHLIRIETRAGHGTGKPTDKKVAAGVDVLAFLAQFTGLRVPE